METAIQELIEEFEIIKTTKCKTLQEMIFFDGILAIIESKYLEKEKEQIIEAFEYGQINVNEDGCLSTEDGAQEYYDEKYTKYKKLPKDVKDWLNKL